MLFVRQARDIDIRHPHKPHVRFKSLSSYMVAEVLLKYGSSIHDVK